MNIRPRGSAAICSVSRFSFCCLDGIISIDIFKFLNPPTRFLNFSYCICKSKICFQFLCFLAVTSRVFIHFSTAGSLFLMHSFNSGFKIFVRRFQYLGHLVMATIGCLFPCELRFSCFLVCLDILRNMLRCSSSYLNLPGNIDFLIAQVVAQLGSCLSFCHALGCHPTSSSASARSLPRGCHSLASPGPGRWSVSWFSSQSL